MVFQYQEEDDLLTFTQDVSQLRIQDLNQRTYDTSPRQNSTSAPRVKCTYCHMDFHEERNCWRKYPHLKPGWYVSSEYYDYSEYYEREYYPRYRNQQQYNSRDVQIPSGEALSKAQKEDETIQILIHKKSKRYKYQEENGIWYSNDMQNNNVLRLLVPEIYKNVFLDYYHVVLGCHQGANKTYLRMAESLYWTNMQNQVNKFVSRCSICKSGKPDHRPRHIQERLPNPKKPFEIIHIDFIESLPKGRHNYKYICTILDAFSRYIIAIPITHKSTNKIIKILVDEVFSKHHVPNLIITDSVTEFTSQNFIHFCERNNIKNHFSSPRSYNSNGKVKRVKYTIENLLRCTLLQYNGNWVNHLSAVVTAINTSQHFTTKHNPCELIGEPCRTNIDYIDLVKNPIRPNMTEEALKCMKEYQKRNYKYKSRNKYGRQMKYSIGDVVYVKNTYHNEKLKPWYQGPGIIDEIHGYLVCVRFQNGVTQRVHVDFLK